MLRVLHITTSGSDAGGVGQYIRQLSSALVDEGCDVTIAGRVPNTVGASSRVKWISAQTDGGVWSLWQQARLLANLEKYDVIHAHYRKSSLVGRYIARQQNIPLLFSLHLTGIPMGLRHRILSDFGDVTHAPSTKAKDWLTKVAAVPPSRISLIPHGIDPGRYPFATPKCQAMARAQLGLPLNKIVAAYVGRFEHPKNESWVVDLARLIPSIQFVMMGGGPRAAQLNSDLVKLLPYGDPLLVYQAADILLLPSSLEGFSLVAAEAMSVGRPVLRTQTAGVDEMIVEGITGFSCAIDHDEFIRVAVMALSDRERLYSMGQAAATHVRLHLTHERQVQQTLALYREMISKNIYQ